MYISKYDLNGGNLIIKRIAWRCFLCVICFLFICNKHVSIFYLFLICNISFKNSPLIKIPEVTKESAVIRNECHLNYYLTQLYIYISYRSLFTNLKLGLFDFRSKSSYCFCLFIIIILDSFLTAIFFKTGRDIDSIMQRCYRQSINLRNVKF